MKKLNHFDYLNSINMTKKDIMIDDLTEKEYTPFMVNRGLSYFRDTVLYANEMNKYPALDKKLQYDFLKNLIRKGKRFSKWFKPQKEESIAVIMEYYNYSRPRAEEALRILSADQLEVMRQKLNKGGRRR